MITSEDKRHLFDQADAKLDTFFVAFDPRHPEVVVPAELRHKNVVQFQYGRRLPIPTFAVATDRGITCDLAFGGVIRPTFVPWGAVYAIHYTSHGIVCGKVWDMPPAEPKPAPQPERVKQPDGTYSLAAFRAKRAASGPQSA
jgi:Stringent starvation protein B